MSVMISRIRPAQGSAVELGEKAVRDFNRLP